MPKLNAKSCPTVGQRCLVVIGELIGSIPGCGKSRCAESIIDLFEKPVKAKVYKWAMQNGLSKGFIETYRKDMMNYLRVTKGGVLKKKGTPPDLQKFKADQAEAEKTSQAEKKGDDFGA